MQSYYSMLKNRQIVGEQVPKNYKPTFRSSAIFNVFHSDRISSRVLFMGYWILKRNISNIGLLVNLRNSFGELIHRKYIQIDLPKAYRIELIELLNDAEYETSNFEGSIEMEIFSTVDLVYPYPAFVLNYYTDEYCTSVHSMGRVYNDFEDFIGNNEYEVKESGWDIQSTDDITGFFAFVNGPVANKEGKIEYEVINFENQRKKGEFYIGEVAPFSSKKINFNDEIDNLSAFLDRKSGTIKIGHKFQGFFPRFLVGNQNIKTDEISITHSYYDSSELSDERSYWNRMDANFLDSSIAIPIYYKDDLETKLAIYPIFSPCCFSIGLRFFTEDGQELLFLEKALKIEENNQRYSFLNLSQLVDFHGLINTGVSSVRIECNWENKQKIPTRVKFGLNVGKKGKLSSNICFAPQLGNPNILSKKGTFKWSPILNHVDSEIVITNSSSLKDYQDKAEVKLTFYNEIDGQSIERLNTIASFGVLKIAPNQDEELKEFMKNQTSWMTITSSNPNVYGWYFDFSKEGNVAADHIF